MTSKKAVPIIFVRNKLSTAEKPALTGSRE